MIRLLGQRNILGGGIHFGEFTDHMRKLSWIGSFVEEVDASNLDALRSAAQRSREGDVNVWFVRHPMWTAFKGAKVVWAIFEADSLPPDFVTPLRDLADAVWVPSRWGHDVLVASGVDSARIDVVPEGVNPHRFHPFMRDLMSQSKRPFRFLAVGKFEERKSYRELFSAFKSIFKNDPAIQLVVKADFFADPKETERELQTLIDSEGLTNAQPVWGAMSSDELLGLYSMSDALVFPSRAEGWGLPLIEALASGLPAITTEYSGHSEFLSTIPNYFTRINHDLEVISDPGYLRFWPGLTGSGARWGAPNVESISRGMLSVFESKEVWQQRAIEASRRIRENFSWTKAADIAYTSLTKRGLYRPVISFK